MDMRLRCLEYRVVAWVRANTSAACDVSKQALLADY